MPIFLLFHSFSNKMFVVSRHLLFYLIGIILFSANLSAQDQFGGLSSRIKWKQQNLGQARIIYNGSRDSLALATLRIFEYLDSGKVHRRKSDKISILLQPFTTTSNAYVTLGPWRSNFYLFPPQNPFELGSVDWATVLALHEYKHVEQFRNFNIGGSHILRLIFGENGQALGNSVSVPDWFFEGDAVWQETKLTAFGRGRMPLFRIGFQHYMQQSKKISYQLLRNGSYKYYVPNHYQFGYQLVKAGNEAYGEIFWNKVTKRAASLSNPIFPLQSSFKKYSGMRFYQFRKHVLDSIKYRKALNKVSEPEWVSKKTNCVTDDKFPYPFTDSTAIVLHSSFKELPVFTEIFPNGNYRTIGKSAIMIDPYFGYNNGKIIYATYHPDTRWTSKQYTDVRILDANTGAEEVVLRKNHCISPDISSNHSWISAVHVDFEGRGSLKIFDSAEKIVGTKFGDSDNFYSHPKFLPGDTSIVVAVRKRDGRMGWMVWNFANNSSYWLLQPQKAVIGFPVIHHNALYFSGTNSELDGLFKIDLNSGVLISIGKVEGGIYQGFELQNKILASVFSIYGQRIAKFEADPSPELPHVQEIFSSIIPSQQLQEKEHNPKTSLPKRFRGFSHPFNFHSTLPYASDGWIGFTLLGRNLLNTIQTNVSFLAAENGFSKQIDANIRYGGWFLQPMISANYQWDNVHYQNQIRYYYSVAEANIGVYLPLNFSRGKTFKFLDAITSLNSSVVMWDKFGRQKFSNHEFNYLHTRVSWHSQSQNRHQQILPKWALVASIDNKIGIPNNKVFVRHFKLNGVIPGFSKTHSIQLGGAYQQSDTLRVFQYSNNFTHARGIASHNFPKLWSLTANYHFPIAYPHTGIPNILYLKRIRGNIFTDSEWYKTLSDQKIKRIQTVGAEIFLDTRIWNQQPISIGFRVSKMIFPNNSQGFFNPFEIIIPTNIFQNMINRSGRLGL